MKQMKFGCLARLKPAASVEKRGLGELYGTIAASSVETTWVGVRVRRETRWETPLAKGNAVRRLPPRQHIGSSRDTGRERGRRAD